MPGSNWLFDRQHRTQTPTDTADAPKYSQATETAVDALVQGLTTFFEQISMPGGRLRDAPTLRKYLRRSSAALDYTTAVLVTRNNPGIDENLPHVVVELASCTHIPTGIAGPYLTTVQEPPRLTTISAGPFDLVEDGATLAIRTYPPRHRRERKDPVISVLTFRAIHFADITAVTPAELVSEINTLWLYGQGLEVPVGLGTGVELRTGGEYGAGTPNEIEIDPTQTSAALLALFGGSSGTGDALSFAPLTGIVTLTDAGAAFTGAVVGQTLRLMAPLSGPYDYRNMGRFRVLTNPSSTSLTFANEFGVSEAFTGLWSLSPRDDSSNVLRPPMHRDLEASDLVLRVTVATQDENTRIELGDLVYAYLVSFWSRDFYTHHGRSASYLAGYPGGPPIEEHWDLHMSMPVRRSGSQEIPRPGDVVGKVWQETLDVQCVVNQYTDHPVYVPNSDPLDPFILEEGDVVVNSVDLSAGAILDGQPS